MKQITKIILAIGFYQWTGGYPLDAANTSLAGWIYFNEFPFVYSNTSRSWHYITTISNSLYSYDYGEDVWAEIQSGSGASPLSYADGLIVGRNDVKNNPSAYGLYTSGQYESIGSTRYDEGVTAGRSQVQANPSANGLYSSSELESAKTAAYNQGYAAAQNVSTSPNTGWAPNSVVSKNFIMVDDEGGIVEFKFRGGISAYAGSAFGTIAITYVYEKTGINTAVLLMNSEYATTRTTLTFISSTYATGIDKVVDLNDGSEESGTSSWTLSN